VTGRNDASYGRGLMNEAVKIGSYEDDDYHISCIVYPVSCIQKFPHGSAVSPVLTSSKR